MSVEKRIETDSFGQMEVPGDKYWGAQTQRSLGNFPIGWEKQPVPIVRALGVIKKACCTVNMAQGDLDATLGTSIAASAQEVIDGKFDDNFPLAVWQTGSGTQSNMNANEVVTSTSRVPQYMSSIPLSGAGDSYVCRASTLTLTSPCITQYLHHTDSHTTTANTNSTTTQGDLQQSYRSARGCNGQQIARAPQRPCQQGPV